jgi:hypothetical protein
MRTHTYHPREKFWRENRKVCFYARLDCFIHHVNEQQFGNVACALKGQETFYSEAEFDSSAFSRFVNIPMSVSILLIFSNDIVVCWR